MPEQALGGIPLGLGFVVKINLMNIHVYTYVVVLSCTLEVSTYMQFGNYLSQLNSLAMVLERSTKSRVQSSISYNVV